MLTLVPDVGIGQLANAVHSCAMCPFCLRCRQSPSLGQRSLLSCVSLPIVARVLATRTPVLLGVVLDAAAYVTGLLLARYGMLRPHAACLRVLAW
jgi:hypothetical protein